MFEGFDSSEIDLGEASVFARHAGEGPPILLLHGHPRTSSTWHKVAPLLVSAGFTVVCADLRGYGRSRSPRPAVDHASASKRAMALDLIALMSALGHDRFAVAGHDRGSYVALRLALDHPDAVGMLAVIDGIPISEHLRRADARFVREWGHWWFFAQPEIPEAVINGDPEGWYKGDPGQMGLDNYLEFREATRRPEVVRGMLEDYRAGLTVDRRDEEADRTSGRQIVCPTLVLWSLDDDMQDLYGDPRRIWRDWAADVSGGGIRAGHHVAEEAPEELADSLRRFFALPWHVARG